MSDVESTRSGGYYSGICLKKEQQVVYEPDFANFSRRNIDGLVFDENDHERPPPSLNFCCGENIKLDRLLLVILIHHLVLLILAIFCITLLTLCEADNRVASGMLAFLSTCWGHILSTKAMIKRISTQPHCFISVVDPAGSGKTKLIGRMIANQEKILRHHIDGLPVQTC